MKRGVPRHPEKEECRKVFGVRTASGLLRGFCSEAAWGLGGCQAVPVCSAPTVLPAVLPDLLFAVAHVRAATAARARPRERERERDRETDRQRHREREIHREREREGEGERERERERERVRHRAPKPPTHPPNQETGKFSFPDPPTPPPHPPHPPFAPEINRGDIQLRLRLAQRSAFRCGHPPCSRPSPEEAAPQ